MSQILMTLFIFLLVTATHLLYCHYQKKGTLYPKVFLILSLLGFNLLWLLFAFFPFDPVGPDLKSTSTFMYLFLIPLSLFFYRAIDLPNPFQKIFKIFKNNPRAKYDQLLSGIIEEQYVQKCLEELTRDGYISQKDNKFHLTGSGNFVTVLLKIFRALSGRSLGD